MIGGANHHFVLQTESSTICEAEGYPDSITRFRGFGEIENGDLVLTGPLYCIVPGLGRVLVPFGFRMIDNEDGTLQSPIGCWWPTGHPEACS